MTSTWQATLISWHQVHHKLKLHGIPFLMCAHANPSAASVSPLASSGRSLLSRLTSPLKSRTRNLTDFHIKPDEPYKKYSPGDLVRGAVVLEVHKPIRLTHLTVCLHGFVRVFKNPNAANQPLPDLGLTASHNPRKSQYFGNGHCSLFQDEQTLCGEGRLDAGVYEFNFELEFPEKDVPTSIDVCMRSHPYHSCSLLRAYRFTNKENSSRGGRYPT